jgi:hypothetical protein
VEDVIVTTRTCYHLLRFVDTAFDSGVFFYLRSSSFPPPRVPRAMPLE